jgi:hypothetical protein
MIEDDRLQPANIPHPAIRRASWILLGTLPGARIGATAKNKLICLRLITDKQSATARFDR